MITTLSSGEARENERDRERDKERAPRGSKSVYLLCVVQVAISVFGDASLVGLKHCRDSCATTKSARDLLFCHSLKHTYANCQTIKAATGGIFHCHCQHPPSHTHTRTTISTENKHPLSRTQVLLVIVSSVLILTSHHTTLHTPDSTVLICLLIL